MVPLGTKVFTLVGTVLVPSIAPKSALPRQVGLPLLLSLAFCCHPSMCRPCNCWFSIQFLTFSFRGSVVSSCALCSTRTTLLGFCAFCTSRMNSYLKVPMVWLPPNHDTNVLSAQRTLQGLLLEASSPATP